MNLEKLAKLAGVSLSTASKAFSGSEEISEETKKKIFDIAKKEGCFEKYNKQKYAKKIIAVICPEITSAYYCSIVSYLESELNRLGALMVLSISNFSAKKEAELISYHLSLKNADGIIVIEAYSKIKYNKDVPIVVINSMGNSDVDSINTDFLSAISDAVKLLKNNGHKKIGFIGEALTKDKQTMFMQAMNKHHLSVNPDFVIVEKGRFETAGYKAMSHFYNIPDRPTAIFCAYDYLALGAIQCIRAHGENVPENYSIIGIDDISFAAHYDVSLTTIKTNTKEICDIALELIMKKLLQKSFSVRQNILIRSELIVRNSVQDLSELQ